MKEITLYRHERMLFALLRASLHERKTEITLFLDSTDEEWKQCHRLAVSQGVMALAWDGVMRLPVELQPPLSVKLAWAAAVERYEKKYLHYCRTADELSRFYAQHGISAIQMKGVGLSAIYPVPCHREGGDIDIYTYSADKSRMSDGEANRLADSLIRQENIDVDTEHSPKHSVFYYKSVPVENHKTFLNVESYKAAGEVEKMLKEHMNPQPTELDGGRVLTPSPLFNMLFVAFHAAQHYGSGLVLHHLCDWACLLKKHGLHIPAGVTDRRFLRFVSALTLLADKLLETDVQVADVQENLARNILEEMLHPRYGTKVPVKGRAGIILYKARRMAHLTALRREVLGASICKTILHSVIAHIREPKTIFQRGTEQ